MAKAKTFGFVLELIAPRERPTRDAVQIHGDELEQLLADFRCREASTNAALARVAAASSQRLRDVFGNHAATDIFVELQQDIAALTAVVDRARNRQSKVVGARRSAILRGMSAHFAARAALLVRRCSEASESLRRARRRATVPGAIAETAQTTGDRLRLILEQEAPADEQLETRELNRLTDSILAVKGLLARMAAMAVDQGSTIDRIDIYMRSAVQSVERGNAKLVKAVEYQNKGCVAMLIRAQTILAALLSVALLIKYSR